MSELIVSRFGGDAAASSEELKRTAEVIKSNPSRKYIIVSAPGSTSSDLGMTDMLYLCHSSFRNHESYIGILGKISDRYKEIVEGLGIDFDIKAEISSLKQKLESGADLDYIGSRGEYIVGKIFAEYLGCDFVDATELIFFNQDGTPNTTKTFITASQKLKSFERAIIPSFYGSSHDGKIKTFPRGDCDTAGALIACAVKADLFEKWSETAKIFSAPPSVISEPKIIEHITYNEAIELNYIGINIMEDNVSLMLNASDIPMKIFSTHHSEGDGMMITPNLTEKRLSLDAAVCIAGGKNFNAIKIHKIGMNKNYEVEGKLFSHFAKHSIASRHYITGIHTMSIFLKNPRFDLKRNEIFNDIQKDLNPDSITSEKGLSLIAVVGEGIGKVEGMFQKIFTALSEANINVKVIDYGSDDLNIIIGVSDNDYENAIKVLYKAVILNN